MVKAMVRESMGPRFETTFGHLSKLEKILSPADASEALVACLKTWPPKAKKKTENFETPNKPPCHWKFWVFLGNSLNLISATIFHTRNPLTVYFSCVLC